MQVVSPDLVVDPGCLAVREWGEGRPVIFLHPLALESSAFSGIGQRMAADGFRTLAVDLPGFGATPAGPEALTPARLAEPVVELARGLRPRPILAGMSLGGRVALEAALMAPAAFCSAVLIAPYLPWIESGVARWLASRLSPELAEQIPLDVAWPVLRRAAELVEGRQALEHDWLARASVRVAYYLSCGATRHALVSAARELALDPAVGPDGIWSRVTTLDLPLTFVWAGRDALLPAGQPDRVDEVLPESRRIDIPCSGHFVSGRHFRCFQEAVVGALVQARDDVRAREDPRTPAPGPVHQVRPCLYREKPEPRLATPIRQLSGEDAVFVYGETPSMPMHTIGTLLLDPSTADGPVDLERLQRTIAARIHLMPPFRQRLIEAPLALARPVLADDRDFRLERHVQSARLPAPGTMAQLAELVASYAEDPLNHTRPLWRMWLVEGLQDGRVAVVSKIHHCMMDGAAGASHMGSLLDLTPEAPAMEPAPTWNPPTLPRPAELLRGPYAPQLFRPVALGRAVVATARGVWSRLRVQRESAGEEAPAASLFDSAPPTPLNGSITPHRVAAFASLPLADVKAVKNAYRVTVNDVVLTACAYALRSYLAARDALPSDPLYCAVPVSTKSEEEKAEFSNKVSMITVRLPTDLEAPEEMLAAVHRAAEGSKRAFSAIQDDLGEAWFDLVPPNLAGVVARLYSGLGLADWIPGFINLLISNVAGPPVPLYLAGARVDAIYPMGPVAEGIGHNITVLSNVDRIDVGLLGCREKVPGIESIAAGLGEAIAHLKATAAKRCAA